MDYLYLHGFASSPQSAKGQFLQARLQALGQSCHCLDLNQGDFAHLTLTRQIHQGAAWVRQRDRVTVIGSSLGGLTAAWIAQQPGLAASIHRLVLLAPAFQFLPQWLPRLGATTLSHWRATGWLSVYHYGTARQQPLSYEFVTDAQRYDDTQLTAPIPTLILHGRQDEVIDIQASRDYAAPRPWVDLVELAGDHSLTTVYDPLWAAIQRFLDLSTAR